MKHPCSVCITLSLSERKEKGLHRFHVDSSMNCSKFCKEYKEWNKNLKMEGRLESNG